MKARKLVRSPACVMLLFAMAVPSGTVAESPFDKCTIAFGNSAINQGRASELCNCTGITRGLVRNIQRRSDFVDLLDEFNSSCPGLGNILGDVPTATRNRAGGSRLAGDPGGDEEVHYDDPEPEDPTPEDPPPEVATPVDPKPVIPPPEAPEPVDPPASDDDPSGDDDHGGGSQDRDREQNQQGNGGNGRQAQQGNDGDGEILLPVEPSTSS
ncbi:hypothetical protein R3X27_16445 [Tropicimonas sp. TH_r6]|uniref:hypothetical protein n=1 Tax=Tropicimonas sp. TH_r6 TaxID=3082085 RepID=UPI00295469B9|nr:hypothetical protein [Tropicimonas sp. TH_r6]MDV7144276.1 hypothetical protein [Tropicimonas sp. TH_r6]